MKGFARGPGYAMGPAEASGMIHLHDQVVSVGGRSVAGMRKDEVVQVVSILPRPVAIGFAAFAGRVAPEKLVQRQDQQQAPAERDVRFVKFVKGPLGENLALVRVDAVCPHPPAQCQLANDASQDSR